MGDKRFDELDGKISGLMARQDPVEKRLVELEERMRRVENKVDEHIDITNIQYNDVKGRISRVDLIYVKAEVEIRGMINKIKEQIKELEEQVRSLDWLVKDMALKDVEKQEPTVKVENKSDMYCGETATEAAAVSENIISEIIKKKADEALAEYKVEFDKMLGRFTVTRPAYTEKSDRPEIYVVVGEKQGVIGMPCHTTVTDLIFKSRNHAVKVAKDNSQKFDKCYVMGVFDVIEYAPHEHVDGI